MINYDAYEKFVDTISTNLKDCNFKSHADYTGILEHVSYELGEKYLTLLENEFSEITYENIIGYITINDAYGEPVKHHYKYLNRKDFLCSPTSLRYIYHALVILKYYKESECKNIVEVGCGYGGLCLSIQYFSKLLNVNIINYNIIDLKPICNLIKSYLQIHNDNIYSNINYHESNTYGKNIVDSDLFFISNYCYTEINVEHNTNYTQFLLSKAKNGFLVWQNGGNSGAYPVENSHLILNKKINLITEERPQTDQGIEKHINFFVYF
jgi:hypothetical protein